MIKEDKGSNKNTSIAISIMLAHRTIGSMLLYAVIQIKVAGPSLWPCQGSSIISHQSSFIISCKARTRQGVRLVMPCSNTRKPSLLKNSCDCHHSPEAAANAQDPRVGANGSNTLSVNKGKQEPDVVQRRQCGRHRRTMWAYVVILLVTAVRHRTWIPPKYKSISRDWQKWSLANQTYSLWTFLVQGLSSQLNSLFGPQRLLTYFAR